MEAPLRREWEFSISDPVPAAILETPASDRDTMEDLSQSAGSSGGRDRKLLILNGEMLERSNRHAWKAVRWSSVKTYRITFSAVVSTT
jgi:hypothetical protein